MRLLVVTVVLALTGTLVVDLQPGSAPRAARPVATGTVKTVVRPKTVVVALLRNGRIARVERIVPKGVDPAWHALRELLRGPTREERAQGFRTAFAQGTVRLRFVVPEGDLWRVRMSRGLLGPASRRTVQARLTQIGTTLASLDAPQRFAAVSAEGRLATMFRLGLRQEAWRPKHGEQGYLYSVRGVQLRLWSLGYLDRSDVTGELDYRTSQALLALQGWGDLARTGTVTGQVQVELFRGSRPKPTSHKAGRRLEIHRDRGVLLLLDGNDVVRAVHTSTGAGGATPSGSYRVYRKALYSWSVPFQVWMPYAAYFVGGIATHEYPDVPSYPASHGCVRLPAGDAKRVYSFVDVGTPVQVF